MTNATGVDPGERAPEFTATMVRPDDGEETVSLSSLLEDGPVLLAFYTNDFSPDCIEEWCSFRDYGFFEGEDVQVVGISKSGTYLHERFISYLDLEFPLVSDPDLEVADAYDVSYRAAKLFPRARRSCFLVDTDGVVRYRWLAEHWLDPTRDVPPVEGIQAAVKRVLCTNEHGADAGGESQLSGTGEGDGESGEDRHRTRI
jgi:peroxiredoxin